MLRTILRLSVLVLGAVLALRVLPWPLAAMGLPSLSPFVVACSAVAARAVGLAALLGLPILVVGILLPRGFCRYACPVGLLADAVGRLRPRARRPRFPAVGQWVLLVTVGGSLAGYPLLLWLDPLALFHGFFGALRSRPDWLTLLSAVGLPVVLLFSLAFPRAWCGRICPLGALQDLLAMARRAAPEQSAERRVWRRTVLATGLGVAWALATTRWARAGAPKPLRPPGALDEALFTGVCVRCGNCIRACPERILRPDLDSVAGFLAPVVEFRESYCKEDCRRCIEVCPSGAIRRLSLERKRTTPMGIAKVDMGLCALGHGRECSACILYCPYDAISTAFNEEDYTTTLLVEPGRCPGCGACQIACPMPIKAIVVSPL